MARTPDEFPGTGIQDVILLESGTYIPLINGEIAYVSGSGFRFMDEGVLKPLTEATASFAVTASYAQRALGAAAQTIFKEISVDTTTTSLTFANLLSASIEISSSLNKLEVYFTSANTIAGGSNAGCIFRLQIDGAYKRGTVSGGGTGASNSPGQTAALVYQTGSLSVGTHTVAIQWAVSTTVRTGQIRPVTTTNEHASLIVKEIIG